MAIIPSPSLNALATGRDAKHAVVATTQGILSACDDRQLRAVLAHVKDRDGLLRTFAATLAGAVSYAGGMVLFTSILGGGGRQQNVNPILLIGAAVTAPIVALLFQLAVSRSRELRADEVGARTIGDPEALASALETLERTNDRRPMRFGSPATSSLFIVNPFRGSAFANLFSTHPPLRVRIERLRAMKGGTPLSPGGPAAPHGRRGGTSQGGPL